MKLFFIWKDDFWPILSVSLYLLPHSLVLSCAFSFVLVVLYTKSFEKFKIYWTLLGVTFKSKDVWRFLKLIPFLEASRNTLRRVVGLSFDGRPVDFLLPYASGSCKKLLIIFLDIMGRVFATGPEDRGSIPGRVMPKTLKIVLDTSLFNTQHYKVRINGKVEQSKERSSALPYTSV